MKRKMTAEVQGGSFFGFGIRNSWYAVSKMIGTTKQCFHRRLTVKGMTIMKCVGCPPLTSLRLLSLVFDENM